MNLGGFSNWFFGHAESDDGASFKRVTVAVTRCWPEDPARYGRRTTDLYFLKSAPLTIKVDSSLIGHPAKLTVNSRPAVSWINPTVAEHFVALTNLRYYDAIPLFPDPTRRSKAVVSNHRPMSVNRIGHSGPGLTGRCY